MRSLGIIALRVISAGHAIWPKGLHHAERRELKAPDVALGITHPTSALDADAVKALALVIIEAGDAADAAVVLRHAERRLSITARVIGQITDHAVIADTLSETLVLALIIAITRDTLIALIARDTHSERAIATSITSELAGLADPEDTLVDTGLNTIFIREAAHAIDTRPP